MSTIIHDIDTMIDYVWDNWRTKGTSARIKPDAIYRNGKVDEDGKQITQKRCWMFKNCIEVIESDTIYKLLDMRGNADALNDTDMKVKFYSKKNDDSVMEMFLEFIYWIRDLAHKDNIGHYAFAQVVYSKPVKVKYFVKMDATVLLTRRGKGHEQ